MNKTREVEKMHRFRRHLSWLFQPGEKDTREKTNPTTTTTTTTTTTPATSLPTTTGGWLSIPKAPSSSSTSSKFTTTTTAAAAASTTTDFFAGFVIVASIPDQTTETTSTTTKPHEPETPTPTISTYPITTTTTTTTTTPLSKTSSQLTTLTTAPISKTTQTKQSKPATTTSTTTTTTAPISKTRQTKKSKPATTTSTTTTTTSSTTTAKMQEKPLPAKASFSINTQPPRPSNALLQELRTDYKNCDNCMEGRRRKECPYYKLQVENVHHQVARMTSLLTFGCPSKDGVNKVCCHRNNQQIDQFLRELSNKLTEWEDTLHHQCDKCPVDCEWENWSPWTDCPASCVKGHTKTRSRARKGPFYGGRHCPQGRHTETKPCDVPTPVLREWGTWAPWSQCSSTCGGTQTRARECKANSAFCTLPCQGACHETRNCGSPDDCCISGRWTTWSIWTDCPKTQTQSDQVLRFRNRTCTHADFNKPLCPGQCVGPTSEIGKCCVPSTMSEWTTWSKCSNHAGVRHSRREITHTSIPDTHIDKDGIPCNGGCKNRTRTCIKGTCSDNPSCIGKNTDNVKCYLGPCCVETHWSDWTKWTPCIDNAIDCGTRSRSCIVPTSPHSNSLSNQQRIRSSYLGPPEPIIPRPICKNVGCKGSPPEFETKKCIEPSNGICEKPFWTNWIPWSDCEYPTQRSLKGRRTRHAMDCVNPSRHVKHCKHLGCDGNPEQEEECTRQKCAQAYWSPWNEWSKCQFLTTTATKGIRHRFKDCITPSAHLSHCSHIDCVGVPTQNEDCHRKICIDGGLSVWGAWDTCSVTCGMGRQTRSRRCDSPSPNFCGRGCVGALSEEKVCRQKPCCVDGGFGDWSAWSDCTATCGAGRQTRTRNCDSPTPNHCGRNCVGNTVDVMQCRKPDCCMWSPWSQWGGCSVTCGRGLESRSRQCNSPTSNQYDCRSKCRGDDKQTHSCQKRACCDQGDWSSWEEWSRCSCRHGDQQIKGTRFRSRNLQSKTPGLILCQTTAPRQDRGGCLCCKETCVGKRDGYHPAECKDDCRHFIQCCNGKITGNVGRCNIQGFVFHPGCQYCIRQNTCPAKQNKNTNNKCPVHINTPLPRCPLDPSGCSESCTGLKDGYYLSKCKNQNDRKYFRCCEDNVAAQAECPPHLIFNTIRKCCINRRTCTDTGHVKGRSRRKCKCESVPMP